MKVIEKPWGREEVIEINDRYMVKKLTMFEGKKCSLQYHNYKKETIYVLSGKLRIYTKAYESDYKTGKNKGFQHDGKMRMPKYSGMATGFASPVF